MYIRELGSSGTGLEAVGQATATHGNGWSVCLSDGAAIKFFPKKFPINGSDGTTQGEELGGGRSRGGCELLEMKLQSHFCSF